MEKQSAPRGLVEKMFVYLLTGGPGEAFIRL
jgi:hypothetical protein